MKFTSNLSHEIPANLTNHLVGFIEYVHDALANSCDLMLRQNGFLSGLKVQPGQVSLLVIPVICLLLPFTGASAKHDSQEPLSPEEWQELMAKVTLLDNAVLIPSLLPVIMTNRDALELSEEQLARIYTWRKDNYVKMVNLMNEVIEKRVQFRIESLSPSVTDVELIAFQQEIQHVERELLKIRLSCRAIVMETFTKEQWASFEFLVADDPKLGSLISQRNTLSLVNDQ